jgi:hypothetical protein
MFPMETNVLRFFALLILTENSTGLRVAPSPPTEIISVLKDQGEEGIPWVLAFFWMAGWRTKGTDRSESIIGRNRWPGAQIRMLSETISSNLIIFFILQNLTL